MELGFNVRNAGPLSQVSFHIISLDTAVYLATGAYGWWKARERSKSLIKLLEFGTGKLISPSSFNLPQYASSRSVGVIRNSLPSFYTAAYAADSGSILTQHGNVHT
jgi:hypothetical protein